MTATTSQLAEPHQKLHGLDHLRAFAIFSVFLFHYNIISKGVPGWLPAVAKFGWTGVDLFFVLSGFLISSQLFAQMKRGEPISFRVFFLKRAFRILPAFWVTVAIYFLIPFFREKEALPPLWKFLCFAQNLGLDAKDKGTFSHAWSLCVEEHFYLLLPLTLIAIQFSKWRRRSYWLLIALFALGFFLRYVSYVYLYMPKQQEGQGWMYWAQYLYYPTYNRLDGLLAGVSIAALYVFKPMTWQKLSAYGNQFILLGLLVLLSTYFVCKDEISFRASVFGFPLVSIGYGCIVMGAVCPTSFLYKWSSKTSSFIAAISYAVYLTHKGMIHVTHVFLADYSIDDNIILLLSTISSVVGAIVLHRVIEKPFMNWRRKLVG